MHLCYVCMAHTHTQKLFKLLSSSSTDLKLSLHFNSAMPKQQKNNKEPKKKTYRNTYAIVNVNIL